MDGITEPVILVLGHPIAGNPAQFALERAFESLDLAWRVLSCDVPPGQIEEALSGAEVLGFRGLLLDNNLIEHASRSRAELKTEHESIVPDLYWRDDESGEGWNTENVLATWLESEIRRRCEDTKTDIGPLLWIGTPDDRFPSALASEQSQSPISWASEASIERSNLIAISQDVDFSQWPKCEKEQATLVVDFANPPNDVESARSLGYEVLGREEARIGMLLVCIERWTGRVANVEVLTEAVEEYLAI